jgi:sugar/nucleoside kinase (ribokinase family)
MAQAIAPVLGLAGSLVGAVGQSKASNYAAQQSARAAQVGRVQADQVDASYRDELNSTISNIRAIRASSGTGANSPTGMAIEAKQEDTSNRDRRIEVGNKNMQANQDDADAKFRRSSAKTALFGGVASGLAKFAGSGGFDSSTYALGG